jgi:hypothetical protein
MPSFPGKPGIKNIPDAEVEPDVQPDVDADVITCIPETEVCDGKDNDCNDVVDDYWAPTEQGGQTTSWMTRLTAVFAATSAISCTPRRCAWMGSA